MNPKKIFIVLITIVACVLIGALVLNILLPNTATALVNSTEDMIYRATGMSFDFNGDNNAGSSTGTYGDMNKDDTGTSTDSDGTVEGFE